MKKIFFTMMIISSVTFAKEAGNGGGSICYPNTKCMTLAEAGLKIPMDIPLFILPMEAENQVIKILNLLPETKTYSLPYKSVDRIMGDRDTFTPIEQNSKRKFKTVIDAYTDILKKYPSNLSKYFVLDAVSEQREGSKDTSPYRTYLLPPFFTLSPTDQALVLIHEANVRGYSSEVLPYALQFDGLVFDALSGKQIDPLTWVLVTTNLYDKQEFYDKKTTDPHAMGSEKVFEEIVDVFSKKIGRKLRISDFCDQPLYGTCEVRHAQALRGNQIFDPRFASIFYGMKIYNLLDSMSIYMGYKSDLPASHAKLNPNICDNIQDDQVLDYAGFDNGSFLSAISCNDGVATRVKIITGINGLMTR